MRILLFGIVFLFLSSCGRARTAKSVTVKGSDTMVILGQRWAEYYMKKYPGIIVQVTGGGSGTGIAALIDGATDIAQASRVMKEAEKEKARTRQGKEVYEIPVALDGLAIYVNKNNPLEEISLAELKEIFTGKSKNWKTFIGSDAPIIIYSRENNSGTYLYFKEHVLENEDFAKYAQYLPGTAAIVNAVSKDINAIGYGGIGYAHEVKYLKVKRDKDQPGVAPTLANVQNKIYPISRELYFYTLGEPQGEIKKFVDWVLSTEGQAICKEVGYYPLYLNAP